MFIVLFKKLWSSFCLSSVFKCFKLKTFKFHQMSIKLCVFLDVTGNTKKCMLYSGKRLHFYFVFKLIKNKISFSYTFITAINTKKIFEYLVQNV